MPAIHDVHHVPGRLRVRSRRLRRNEDLCAEARAYVMRLDGVEAVTANPVTGSLIIRFDAAAIDAPALLDALRLQGYVSNDTLVALHVHQDSRRTQPDHDLLQHAQSTLAKVIVAKLVEILVARATRAVIAAVI